MDNRKFPKIFFVAHMEIYILVICHYELRNSKGEKSHCLCFKYNIDRIFQNILSILQDIGAIGENSYTRISETIRRYAKNRTIENI